MDALFIMWERMRELVSEPGIEITGGRVVKGGEVGQIGAAIPIDGNEINVAVHEADDVLGVVKLGRLLSIVRAEDDGGREFRSEDASRRVMHGSQRFAGEAGFVAVSFAVEKVAGVKGFGEMMETDAADILKQEEILNGGSLQSKSSAGQVKRASLVTEPLRER